MCKHIGRFVVFIVCAVGGLAFMVGLFVFFALAVDNTYKLKGKLESQRGFVSPQERLSNMESKLAAMGIRLADHEARISELETYKVKYVTITAYTLDKAETDSDPFHTAFMLKPRPGGTVAVSWDLFRKGWQPPKCVYIEGFGKFWIADLMNRRFTERIDICVSSKRKAMKINCMTWATLID